MPRGWLEISLKMGGQESSSNVSTLVGMVRNTAPAPRACTNALTRKRAKLGMSNEKSHSKCSSYTLRCPSFMMSYTMPCTSLCSIGGRLMRRISPCTRIMGGNPAERCRSDALFLTAKARSSVMSIADLVARPAAVGAGLELVIYFFADLSSHYGNNFSQLASREVTNCRGRAGRRKISRRHQVARGEQGLRR